MSTASPVPDSPGKLTKQPPCTWTSSRSRFSGGISAGVSRCAFTPSMTIGSTRTFSASRSAGSPFMAASAPALTCAFQPSAVSGMTFQVGVSGAAISLRICGLTVSGTGSVFAGTSRGPGAGACAPAVAATSASAAAATAPAGGRRCRRVGRIAGRGKVGMGGSGGEGHRRRADGRPGAAHSEGAAAASASGFVAADRAAPRGHPPAAASGAVRRRADAASPAVRPRLPAARAARAAIGAFPLAAGRRLPQAPLRRAEAARTAGTRPAAARPRTGPAPAGPGAGRRCAAAVPTFLPRPDTP